MQKQKELFFSTHTQRKKLLKKSTNEESYIFIFHLFSCRDIQLTFFPIFVYRLLDRKKDSRSFMTPGATGENYFISLRAHMEITNVLI